MWQRCMGVGRKERFPPPRGSAAEATMFRGCERWPRELFKLNVPPCTSIGENEQQKSATREEVAAVAHGFPLRRPPLPPYEVSLTKHNSAATRPSTTHFATWSKTAQWLPRAPRSAPLHAVRRPLSLPLSFSRLRHFAPCDIQHSAQGKPYHTSA